MNKYTVDGILADKHRLYELYWGEPWHSIAEIADNEGYSAGLIQKALHSHGIPTRSHKPIESRKHPEHPDEYERVKSETVTNGVDWSDR